MDGGQNALLVEEATGAEFAILSTKPVTKSTGIDSLVNAFLKNDVEAATESLLPRSREEARMRGHEKEYVIDALRLLLEKTRAIITAMESTVFCEEPSTLLQA